MDREIAKQENKELRGNMMKKGNEESLEISSTGYGYVSVRNNSKQKKTDGT